MPRIISPGSGLTSPVGVADGGTGQATRAAALAALIGLTSAPPTASNWTAYNSATIADYAAGGISITRTITGSINLRGALIAQGAGDFDVIARVRNAAGICSVGLCLRDSGGAKLVLLTRTVDAPPRVLVVAYSNSTTYSSTPLDTTHRSSVASEPIWFRIRRVGTTLSFYMRNTVDDDWALLGTRNDTTDIGFTAISHLGIAMDPNIVGASAEAVAVCDYWSRT